MHSFHWWQLFEIYCVTVKKFSLLEALPWANWSWLLFLFHATMINSDTVGETNSGTTLNSGALLVTRSHQVSSTIPAAEDSKLLLMLFTDVLKEGEGFSEVLVFWAGVDPTLFLVQPLTPFYFFYPSTADQTLTGESWNWEERQCILKIKTFLVDLVM